MVVTEPSLMKPGPTLLPGNLLCYFNGKAKFSLPAFCACLISIIILGKTFTDQFLYS